MEWGILKKLLRLRLLASLRTQTISSKIIFLLLGLFVLYFLVCLSVLGWFSEEIIYQLFPKSKSFDIIKVFTIAIFYLWLLDINLRIIFQKPGNIDIYPFLSLPVKKRTLTSFIILSDVISLFNIYFLFLLVPISVKIILPHWGFLKAVSWLLIIMLSFFINHFSVTLLKRKRGLKYWQTWIIPLTTMLLIFLSLLPVRQEWFQGAPYSFIIVYIMLIFIFSILAVLIYRNCMVISGALYFNTDASYRKPASFFTIEHLLNRPGLPGRLALLELKLIVRNKRPRQIFLTGLILYAYLLFLYNTPLYRNNMGAGLVFGIIFISLGIFNYGQFMYSWQSGYFDFILTAKIPLRDFFEGKRILFLAYSTIMFILSLGFTFYDKKILLISIVAYVYNIGINLYLMLLFANKNRSRIDLSKSSFFNYEGVRGTQYLLIALVILIPLLLYLAFAFFKMPTEGLVLIGIIGVAGIICNKAGMKLIIRSFKKNRYRIAEGFRK